MTLEELNKKLSVLLGVSIKIIAFIFAILLFLSFVFMFIGFILGPPFQGVTP